MTDSELTPLCEARCMRDGWTHMARCNQPSHAVGLHLARHPHEEGVMVTFAESEAIYPKGTAGPLGVEGNLGQAGRPVNGASERQVGGDHYKKHAIQPWDIWDAYDLDRYRANALKYLLRAGDKGPAVEDLQKAVHYLEKAIEMEEGK